MGDPANSLAREAMLGGWDLMRSHFLKSEHAGWTRLYAEALRHRLEKRTLAPAPATSVQACPEPGPQTHLAKDNNNVRRTVLTGGLD